MSDDHLLIQLKDAYSGVITIQIQSEFHTVSQNPYNATRMYSKNANRSRIFENVDPEDSSWGLL